VASARAGLTAAKNSADNATNLLASAAAALKSAQSNYCALPPTEIPAFCTSQATPISSGDTALLNTALGSTATGVATAANGVIGANAGYLNAVNGKSSADAAVTSAGDSLESAEARLAAAEDGPSSGDVSAATAAVASAEASLRAAQERLSLLRSGGTNAQRSTAAAAVISAGAALDAAQAARDKALRGADANAIEQAQVAIQTAQLQVQAAEIRLKNSRITAPFAGTVGGVNIKPGELFSAAAVAESGGAISLLTPERLTLAMSVGETDYRSVQVGQAGGALFDGIPGAVYPFTITEIGLNPTVTQGVVTYDVKASIIILGDNPRPAPGMNARGQIITSSKPDVLTVPPRAIRTSGTDQVVDRKNADGTVEAVVVTTGATDPDRVEIVSGLNEGDIVLVVTITSGEDEDRGASAVPTLPGGIR
jgi:HlyD family secretion protein